MLSKRLKSCFAKDRPMTSITPRIPVDVLEPMKTIAFQRGFKVYQTLLKAYLRDGLRRDTAQLAAASQARLIDALKCRGVAAELIETAAQELLAA